MSTLDAATKAEQHYGYNHADDDDGLELKEIFIRMCQDFGGLVTAHKLMSAYKRWANNSPTRASRNLRSTMKRDYDDEFNFQINLVAQAQGQANKQGFASFGFVDRMKRQLPTVIAQVEADGIVITKTHFQMPGENTKLISVENRMIEVV